MAIYQDTSGNRTEIGNADLNPDLVAGKTLVQNDNPPAVSTTINASSLGGQSLSLPNTPAQPDYLSALNSIPQLESITTQLPAQTSAENTQKTISDKLLSAYQKLTGKTVAQQQAEATAGLPGYQKQLTDVNNQIQALQKEAQAIPLQLQESVQGRGVTSGGLAPIQTSQLRQNTIKSLGLSSIAQTLQGNIALAQQQADKAVELQFAPIQAEIDGLKQAYEMNKDVLAREDSKQAKLQQIQLQERQRLLDNAKEDKKTVLSFISEAAKNGAPTLLLNQAQGLNDPKQVLSLLSGYMSDPNAKIKALADIELTRANTAKAYADIAKTNADTAKLKSETTTLTTTQNGNKNFAIVNDINNILADKNFDQTFGVTSIIRRNIPGNAQYTLNAKIDNVLNQLSLAARGQLKGQGAVSDFEGKMLRDAQTSLKLNMNPDDARKELVKIKGAITTSSGGSAMVKITDKNGNSKVGDANQQMITDAINSGYRVEYQ